MSELENTAGILEVREVDAHVITPAGKYTHKISVDFHGDVITTPSGKIINLESIDTNSVLETCGNFIRIKYTSYYGESRVVFISSKGNHFDIPFDKFCKEWEVDEDTGNLLIGYLSTYWDVLPEEGPISSKPKQS